MLTADDEYSHNNRENLLPTIQVQSSKKPKTFCCRYIAFMESSLNFEYFEKKKEPQVFLKLLTPKDLVT